MNRCKGCCCKCGLMERPRTEGDVQNVYKHQTWRSRRRFMEHVTYLPAMSNPQTDQEDEAFDGLVATRSISLLNRIQPVQRMKQQWEAKLEQENEEVAEKHNARQSRRYQNEESHVIRQEQFLTETSRAKYWKSRKTFQMRSEARVERQRIQNEPPNLESGQVQNHERQNGQRDSYIESKHIKQLLRDSGDYSSQPPTNQEEDARNLPVAAIPASSGDHLAEGTCTVVDKWYMSCDSGSLLLARRIVKQDASSPSGDGNETTLTCALKAMKDAELKGGRCGALLPEEFRRYMAFFTDQRIADYGLLQEKNLSKEYCWWDTTVSSLKLRTPLTISPEAKVQYAIDIMRRKGFDQMPVVDGDGGILGMITLGSLLTCMLEKKMEANDPVVESALDRQFRKVRLDMTLGQLTHILKTDHYVLVTHSHIECSEHGEKEKEVIIGIVTQIDLLNYITGVEEVQKSISFYETPCVLLPVPDSDAVAIPEP